MKVGESKAISLGHEIARARKSKSDVFLCVMAPYVADEDGFIPAQSVHLAGKENLIKLRDLIDEFLSDDEGSAK